MLLGLGLLAHGLIVLSSARRLPAAFSAPTATTPPSAREGLASTAATATAAPTSAAAATGPASVRRGPAPFLPTRLRIRALGVDAPVVQVVSSHRTLVPPENPRQVGWWVAGSPAGSASGATVIVGHVDSAVAGLGALFRLDHVRAGETIELSGGQGHAAYRVASLHFYVKTAGLPAALFDPASSSRLVLVSCGGPFDAAKRSYRDNVVVTATLGD